MSLHHVAFHQDLIWANGEHYRYMHLSEAGILPDCNYSAAKAQGSKIVPQAITYARTCEDGSGHEANGSGFIRLAECSPISLHHLWLPLASEPQRTLTITIYYQPWQIVSIYTTPGN